nr:capsid protein [Rat picobirnavirus]
MAKKYQNTETKEDGTQIDRTNNHEFKSGKQRRRNRNRKPKEVEVNVPSKSINLADMPHVVTTAKADNDPSWYTHIWPVVGDVAKLPFSSKVGQPINTLKVDRLSSVGTGGTYTLQTSTWANTITGIMTLKLAPTAGFSDGPDSAINVAMEQILTKQRAANAGRINYDRTEIMFLVQAMDSAYMLYEELTRVNKIFGCYDYKNAYLPDALIQSLGFSPNLVKDWANFKKMLDLFAYKLGSINVPDQFDFIHRHIWLYTNVYKDASDSKSQFYAYVPHGYYVFKEGQENSESYLSYTTRQDLYGAQLVDSLDQIQQAIDTIMNPILGSEDLNLVSADLVKAFGEGGMIKIRPVEDNEAFAPVYSQEVLLQMMNAIIFNTNQIAGNDITVDNSNLTTGPFLVCKPTIPYTDDVAQAFTASKPIVNFIDMETTPENILVATRLMPSVERVVSGVGSGSTAVLQITSSGTEICASASLWKTNVSQFGISTVITETRFGTNLILSGSTTSAAFSAIQSYLPTIARLSQFDWAPTVKLWYSGTDGGNPAVTMIFQGFLQDLCNYRVMEDADIEGLNEVAIMSLYALKDYKTALTK